MTMDCWALHIQIHTFSCEALQMMLSRSTSAASLGIFLLVASCFAEKAPYTSFAKDAILTPPIAYYDYIIIGGGTAGCALAATLSSVAKVVVLERGGLPYDIPSINKSGVLLNLLDTSPNSAAQPFISTDGVYNHRGRVLGGGSAINLGFYSRASDKQVREAGWDPRLVNESYEWVERKLVSEPRVMRWQAAVRDGLVEAGVLPERGFRLEHLYGTKVGGSTFDENGGRHGAADLLEFADPINISVHLHAMVYQILFQTIPGQRPKAYGVLYRDSKGISHVAYLNKSPTSEVILSAGAIGSPQLLMLSGIGPAQQLQTVGIELVLDQTMVGQGLTDNPLNVIIIPSPRPVELSLVEVVGITESGNSNYIEAASGLIDLNLALIKMPQAFANLANQSINTQIGVIGEKVATPYSTGYLELQSRDPKDNPRVTFNYFKDPRDIHKCVQGMEIIKRVVESHAFSSFRYPLASFQTLMDIILLSPLNLRRKHLGLLNHSMEQFCIDTVMTTYHYHGGCQVGKVVDHDYKVLGVDSLRVIDGSTFLESPGTNPQATLMMLGRYMGQKILRE